MAWRILEAETASTISDEHTASQWSLFADAAQQSGGEFHVVVPKECRRSAAERAAALYHGEEYLDSDMI